jgi:hypothetical protein
VSERFRLDVLDSPPSWVPLTYVELSSRPPLVPRLTSFLTHTGLPCLTNVILYNRFSHSRDGWTGGQLVS